MNVVGIIAEYNPFHNGHKFHINEAKKITNADYVIAIMSGSFTQSGNIAIYDKFLRSKIATEYGADMVIELPTIYATSSAESFAYGSMILLEKLGIVNSICFGSECEDIEILRNIANTLVEKENEILPSIKESLKTGISYPNARIEALKKYLDEDKLKELSKPNNILGIEYLKSLITLNSSITPYCIKRESSDFNEIVLNKKSNRYTSATSIRNMIYQNKINLVENYVPALTYTTILGTKSLFNEDLYKLLKYKILTMDQEKLKSICEINEGLENKIKNEISHSNSYDELIFNLKSKRYTLTKIKRMLINIILEISKEDSKYAKENQIAYAHILSITNKGKKLLSSISENSNIHVITKINDDILQTLPQNISKYLKMDILSTNIYSTLSNDKINKDYINRL